MDHDIMNTAIAESNKLLISSPFAVTVVLGKRDEVHGYHWQDNSPRGKAVRTQIRKLLSDAWQSESVNYQYIADRMRIDDLSIQGLIDEQFRMSTGL
jgi:hypothetical protein